MSFFLQSRILLLIISSLLNFIIGIFILKKTRYQKAGIFLAMLAFLSGIYSFSYAGIYLYPEIRFFWARFTWIAFFIPLTFIFFLNNYLHFKLKKLYACLLIILSTIAFAISLFTDLVVQQLNYIQATNYVELIPGPLDFYCRLIIYFLLILDLFYIKKGFAIADNNIKLRLKYLLIGVSCFIVGGLLLGVFIPLISQYQNVSDELLPILSLIWLSFASYAIIRFRLLDIETFIHKTVGWLITLVVALLPFSILLYSMLSAADFFQLSTAVIIGMIIVYLLFTYSTYALLKDKIDSLFQRKKYETTKIISHFTQSLRPVLNLKELTNTIIEKINNIFYSSSTKIFLELNEQDSIATIIKKRYKILNSEQIINEITAAHHILELENNELDRDFFTALEAELIIPLVNNDRFIGFITLGRKNNGKIYSEFDIEQLVVLAKSLSLLIENRIFYEKIVITLEKERNLEKIKTEFINVFAHQMRTPLSEVKWALQMFIEQDFGAVNSKQKTVIEKSLKSNNQVISLVNNLLDIAQLEEGNIIYHKVPTDFKPLITEIIADFEYKIKKRKVLVNLQMTDKNIPLILIDKNKVKIALSNILDNAIKYSDFGKKINISLVIDSKYAKIAIQDQGIGIAVNEQDKIFSKFYRGNKAGRMDTEGNGIGLYLAKKIIQENYGDITYRSQENKGTEFIIKFPFTHP